MTSARSTPRGLGGLGALFFLGSLAAIAIYVQRQSGDDALALPRTTAAAIAEPEAPAAAPALPWEDRLDLAAAKLVPFTTGKPVANNQPTTGAKPELAAGGLVQELSDGHKILLTVDPVLQDAALQIFRNREVPYAAAVMLDVRDNSVLVLAGHSSMDPKVDPLEVVATAWAPAASVFKLVTTAALLETDAVTATTRVCFSGGLHGITDEELRDDPARDTQCENLADAVAHSYNLVIGKLALAHLGQQQLAEVARKFGFESDLPFEFNVERSPAHIPSDAIERAKVAAGFWNIDMSPVHGAVLASIFATGGMLRPPHVIAQVIGPDGTDLTPAPPKADRAISRELAELIGQMMVATTTQGTARGSFRDGAGHDYIEGVTVAGKTGSLTGRRSPSLNYNWFIGYAPADRPEIAFAVLLANEPKWRIKAHYAARRLVQLYVERRGAIARARDARLSANGLVVPERDPSGALLAATSANKAASTPAANPTGDASAKRSGTAGDSTPSAAQAPDELRELPPPPTDQALPPIPAPVPSEPPAGPMGAP